MGDSFGSIKLVHNNHRARKMTSKSNKEEFFSLVPQGFKYDQKDQSKYDAWRLQTAAEKPVEQKGKKGLVTARLSYALQYIIE